MSLVRFRHDDGSIRSGYRFAEDVLDLSIVFDAPEPPLSDQFAAVTELLASTGAETTRLAEPDLEVPVEPSKIIRLDGCYEHDTTDDGFNEHLESADLTAMETPSLWVAPNSTLTSHRGTVNVPAQMTDVRPGVELGIVIGSPAQAVDLDDALDAVGGFTVCMDIAAHDDIPGLEGYRMFDTSLPCGPGIVDPETIDPAARALGLRRNGEPVDVQSTTSLRFSITELVSYVSNVMTLSPGDLITTGTPIRGAPAVEDGDTIEAWIESVGTLAVTIEWGSDDE
jgi:5-oxopent-3-ene-1,2,5-tricarboxylate decarboxylase/2-hydroxyhepta-2,4-diene-1,7-dioate isomerase